MNLSRFRFYFPVALFPTCLRKKNNKTLDETLACKRYARLRKAVEAKYSKYLRIPLGDFLFDLKSRGDPFYAMFLNGNGDRKYCIFKLADRAFYNAKGIYPYLADTDCKYIGRCLDSLHLRVDNGYGTIHPKNCYLDGQSTNCHLNRLIAECREAVSLWIYRMKDEAEIKKLEKQLIKMFNPEWNIALRTKTIKLLR